jgi:hypothetical protein
VIIVNFYEKQYQKMTASVVVGTLMVMMGTILSVILDAPETLWLLTMFLVLVIVLLILKAMKKLDILSPPEMFIFIVFIAIISWGEYAKIGIKLSDVSLPIQLIIIERAAALAIIWLGSKGLDSLFEQRNYRFIKK